MSALDRVRIVWYRYVTCRRRWEFVHCRAGRNGSCCYAGYGDGDSEFMGCQADLYNDWVDARFWRRWVANVRDFADKGGAA